MEELASSLFNFLQEYWLNIVLIIIFLMFSAFFSGSETALYSIDRFRREKLSLNPDKKYSYAKKLLSKPNELLVTILFGNMIVNIFLSTVVDNTLLGANPILAIVISTFIILIFGEVLPKFIAINNSWNITLIVSKFIYFFSKIITPFRYILYHLSILIVNLFEGKENGSTKKGNLSNEDLKAILQMAIDDDIIPKDEAHLIENVFEFADLEVRNVMTPRINLFALPKDISFSKLLFECKRNRHSKIPIYKDTPDDIIGVVYLKELIPYYFISKKDRKDININSFIKNVHFVPERKALKDLLQEFISEKINFAVVIDEYGGTEGIVTLNDCIEQILGKFIDQDEDQGSRLVSKITDKKYIVSGECSITDFHKYVGVDLEDEEAETIAGYMLKKFDKIPSEGEKISDNKCEYEIKDVNQNKIEQILVLVKNEY